MQVSENDPVIICPNRLYAKNFRILVEVADQVFGKGHELISPLDREKRRRSDALTGKEVVVFGKYFGKELGIPTPPGIEDGEVAGSFYIDFLLAKLDANDHPTAFAAVEVQTIDTTNSYRDAAAKYKKGKLYRGRGGVGVTNAGLNWENVSKRILPQVIYKGQALRREALCIKGLFFVLPHAVFLRIKRRLGGTLLPYPMSAGSVTFRTYDLGAADASGERQLVFRETMTTTVEQIAHAFVSPQNLPAAGVYENVIADTVKTMAAKKKLPDK